MRKSWIDRLSVDAASAVLGIRDDFCRGKLDCSAAALAKSIKSHIDAAATAKTIQEWLCQASRDHEG